MQKNTLLILIATILIFSIGWPINKMGLAYMSPVTFAAARLVVGTVCMFLFVIFTKQFIWPARGDLPIILTIGIFQVGLFIVLINLGMNLIEVGRSTILVYTTPIWVTPIAIIFFKEKTSLLKWCGLILGMLGIFILFSPSGLDWHNTQKIWGNILLLLSAMSWAAAILCAKYMKWQHTLIQLFPWQLLVGTLPILVLAYFEPHTQPMHWDIKIISILLFVGIFPQALGALGALVVSRELPSITTSLSFLAVPVLGIIFAHLLLDEVITRVNVIAMLFIFAGLILIALDQKRHHHVRIEPS